MIHYKYYSSIDVEGMDDISNITGFSFGETIDQEWEIGVIDHVLSNEVILERSVIAIQDKTIKRTSRTVLAYCIMEAFSVHEIYSQEYINISKDKILILQSHMLEILKKDLFILDALLFLWRILSDKSRVELFEKIKKEALIEQGGFYLDDGYLSPVNVSNYLSDVSQLLYDAITYDLEQITWITKERKEHVYAVILHLENTLSPVNLVYNTKESLSRDIKISPEYHPEFLKMEYPSWTYHKVSDKLMIKLYDKLKDLEHFNLTHRELFFEAIMFTMRKIQKNFHFDPDVFCRDLFFSLAIYNPLCEQDFYFMESAAKTLNNNTKWTEKWMQGRRHQLNKYNF